MTNLLKWKIIVIFCLAQFLSLGCAGEIGGEFHEDESTENPIDNPAEQLQNSEIRASFGSAKSVSSTMSIELDTNNKSKKLTGASTSMVLSVSGQSKVQ